jgi:hypothetical protein
MIYLTNSASYILYQAASNGNLDAPELGFRFQHLVASALRRRMDLRDLYENAGAGQPDCYSNESSYGFEVKCQSSNPIILDENSWNALTNYKNPTLVAMLKVDPPYPLWVVNLSGVPRGPISVSRHTRVNAELESHLQRILSQEIEAVGLSRLIQSERSAFREILTPERTI